MRQAESSYLQCLVETLASRTTLAEAERETIRNLPAEIVHAPPNAAIVSLGERVDHSCFVAEGLVGRFELNADGQRQITALYIPGEIPDLHSVVLPHATFALQALTQTTIIRIPHSAIRAAAAVHPVLAEAFWRSCVVDAMILAQWVVNIGRRNAQCRLAHLICEMAARYKGADLSGRVIYNLPLTQAHLADATGLTSVHVSRSLHALKAHGVELRRGTVYIDEWNRLAKAAEFDASYLH